MDNDVSILSALKLRQEKDGSTQVQLAATLGIHQAHLSKVMAGKVPLSRKLKARAESLLRGDRSSDASADGLERELIKALRTSSAFRALMHAAMQLHKRGGKR